MIWRWLALLVAISTATYAQFKTCAESETCTFLRNKPANPSEFQVLTAFGVVSTDSSITLNVLKNAETVLQFTASFIQDNIIRLQITELFDSNRYYLDTALGGEPLADETPLNWLNQNAQNATVVWGGDHLLVVHSDPFSIEINHQNDIVAIFNAEGRLTFDHDGINRAVGFDIRFPLATLGYGLPLHADDLVLRQTGDGGEDPYRLYNVNVENYEINSTQALAGAVPVLFAHGPTHTSGVFFHNAYETWVDIDYSNNLATHFMVEDGVFDAFILLGPTPSDVYRQYISLTGVTPQPPIWSLGYHHGALPTDTSDSLLNLVSSFVEYEIPIESVWISGQDASFGWDLSLYPNPLQFLQGLLSTNRKAVLSVNTFIPADLSYDVFLTAVLSNYLVLAPSRQPYIGSAYLGQSSWWDFTNPYAVQYFTDLLSYLRFTNSTSTLAGYWNILNEPAAIDTTENILPTDNIHYTGYLHRDVHNIYSHLSNQATYMALLQRDGGFVRPFVLADSFFAGSQRYAAIYTGNSEADWEHLIVSYRMCLSASLAGIPFCGSDVGGFSGAVTEELLVRWYQLSVWLPLFRTSSLEEGRDPTKLSDESRTYIKHAIDLRYSIINYFYTLFHEHERFHVPVIRPLFYQYPESPATYEVQNGFLVGDEILVYPITQSNQTSHIVYLPPGQIWFDIETPLLYTGYGFTLVDVSPDRIPVFYRGGGVIARRNGLPKTTVDLRGSSFSVFFFLDTNHHSEGRLYLDDGSSFNYRNGIYSYLQIEFTDEVVSYGPIDLDASYPDDQLVISQYLIYRPPSSARSIEDAGPIPITPEVYNVTADGTPLKDIQINLNKRQSIRLR